jgi:hypothetical protein
MSGAVRIATGNAAKVDLLGGFVSAAGFTPVMADPGDAEDRAAIGYRTAVLAKLAGVSEAGPPVIAHDSGFEFACLGGAPGPQTKAWLAETPDLGRVLVPGTGVRVVHCVGLRQGTRIRTFIDHDDRLVLETFTLRDSKLPLTDCFAGPCESLARLMRQALAAIGAPATDGTERKEAT